MAEYPYHQSLQLKNFTVFGDTSFEFVPGVNLFVGENGTGKTHLMKLLYAAQRTGTRRGTQKEAYIVENLATLFQTQNLAQLIRIETPDTGYAEVNGKYQNQEWLLTLHFDTTSQWSGSETPLREAERPVFIPAIDMMGHTRGFLQAASEVVLDFDSTCFDIVSLLGLERKNGNRHVKITETLNELLGGKLEYDETMSRFYLATPKGRIPMPLVAEGMRKIATLVRLAQNGWLAPGTTLFWDEPEVNLNPVVMDEVAGAILALARSGIQVFLATHSYIMLREIEVQSHKSDTLRYFALAQTENGVVANPADSYLEINPNPIEQQYADLYDRSIAKRLKGEAR